MDNSQLLSKNVAQSLVVPTQNHQTFDTSGDGTFSVTLDNPRMIVNPTNSDGMISFMQVGSDVMETEYFSAGQCKPYRVKTVFGNSDGTEISKVSIKE